MDINKDMEVIFVHGDKGSGKDTFINGLIKYTDCFFPAVLPFAGPLKEEVAALMRLYANDFKGLAGYLVSTYGYSSGWAIFHKLQDFDKPLNDYSSNLAFLHDPVIKDTYFRLWLQLHGTEYRRQTCGDDYWTKAHKSSVLREANQHETEIAVPDLRFPNEYEYSLTYENSIRVHIKNDRISRGDNPHISETALDGYKWDIELDNSEEFDDLDDAQKWLVYQFLNVDCDNAFVNELRRREREY